MTEYLVTLHTSFLVNANSEDQAEERAQVVHDALMAVIPDAFAKVKKPWLDMGSLDSEVNDVEEN